MTVKGPWWDPVYRLQFSIHVSLSCLSGMHTGETSILWSQDITGLFIGPCQTPELALMSTLAVYVHACIDTGYRGG